MATATKSRLRISREYWDRMTKERIMRAAARVVIAEGLRAASVERIVREARCSRKTLYDVFDGRHHCLEETVEWFGSEAVQRVEQALRDAGEGFEDRLRTGISALLAYAAERPELAQVFFNHGPALCPRALEEARQRMAAILNANPGLRQDFIVGGVEQVLCKHYAETPEHSPEHLLDALVDLVLSVSDIPAQVAT